ncbi:hypothetical protein [Acetobacter cerevisiae]|uniref:hypothetical protein n=1 Tax=Acetobacter cerevisiae TaxID=178900 RepID=UPI0021567197|nr:hypothetical protein [Acetobacter cerevisiae]GBQ08658.1 hypothetical protein AA14362_1964 [Acetobacter cerevisiae DSM 14362]
MEIGPNDTLGAPRNLDVIKPARFARNYPVFAGLQLFAAAGNGDMDIAGLPLSINSAVVDVGLTAKLTDRIDFGLSYVGQYGNQSVDAEISQKGCTSG